MLSWLRALAPWSAVGSLLVLAFASAELGATKARANPVAEEPVERPNAGL